MADELYTFTPKESCELTDLSCHMSGIADFFSSMFLWLYEKIVMGLASLFDAIPVPSFLQSASSFRLPDVVAWAAEPFQLQYGVGIIVSAYILRFVIRRIPVVG